MQVSNSGPCKAVVVSKKSAPQLLTLRPGAEARF